MEQEVWPLAISGALLVGFIILAGLGIRIAIIIWCYKVGKRKGQELVGLLLGIFLGWIGLIIVYVLSNESQPVSSTPSPDTVTCRNCSRAVPLDAAFCPNCGKSLHTS